MPRRTDSNQKGITQALEKMGCSVVSTHKMGKGFPDLVIGFLGNTYLIEVKSSEKAKFTPDQLIFQENWQGNYYSVVSVEDCERLINELRSSA